MATSKVIGTVEVALDGVKIIGVDGSVRDAAYGASIYEGEQIISANPEALAQVKYVDLSESAAYEGVFRVLADGSVITGSDAMDSIVSDKNLSDIFQTAAGAGDVAESSGYYPSDVVAESSVLGFGRDAGGALSSQGAAGGEGPESGDNIRPVVEDVPLAQNEVLGVEGAGELNVITGQLTVTDSAGDTHSFAMVPGTLSVTDTNGVITMADDSVNAVLNPDGTYRISGDFNDLSDGEVAIVNFDYTATDQGGLTSAPATVTFTVTGTNDIPVVEAINVNDGGTEGGDDYSFAKTASFENNDDTQTLFETHDATDRPRVDDTQDEGNNIYTGTLSVADDDVMNTHEFRVVPDSLVINDPAGSGLNAGDISADITFNEGTQQWEYSINGDFNKLAAGETATVTFQYVADDMRGFDGTDGINESSVSNPANITLTITGTNDQPIVDNITIDAFESHDDDAYQNGADDTQDDVLTSVSATLLASDNDVTDTHIFHAVDMGPSFVTDSQAAYTTELVQPINYDSVDYYQNGEVGTPTNMRVAVQSSYIDPTDIDVTKLVFTSNDGVDSEAGFTLQGNFNALGAGETATVTFKYYADDQNGFDSGNANNESSISELKTVTVTVTGTNDQPVVSDINANGGTGEDIGIPGVIVSTEEGEGGSVTVATGNIVQIGDQVPDGGYEGPGLARVVQQENGGSIDYWHFAHNGGPLTIDMLTEHSAEINGDGVQSSLDSYIYLYRDTGSFDGSSYVAHNDDAGFSDSNGGADGSLSSLDSYLNFNDLPEGDYVLVVGGYDLYEDSIQNGINPNSYSAGPYQITFTSEVPIAFPASAQIVYETHDDYAYQNGADDTQDDLLTTFSSNLATATDDDVNDTHTYQIVDNTLGVTAAPAGVDITDLDVNLNASTGDYTLQGNFNALAAGETATVTFKYQADDGQGFGAVGDANNEASLSEAKTVTLTITGTNDQPIVDNITIDAIESFGDNDRFTSIPGTLVATDDDVTDTHIFHAVDMAPAYDDGPVRLTESTNPQINNSHFDGVAFYQNGDSRGTPPPEHISVLVQSGDINASAINVTKLVFTGNDGDDSSAEFTLKGNFNALGAGDTATVTFGYYADDQNGFGFRDANNESSISEFKTVTITITGTNDQPVVSYAHFDTTEVDDGSQMYTGQLLARDADVGDTHTFEIRSTNDHTTAHGGYEDNGTPNTVVNVGTDGDGQPILAKVISDSAGLDNISLDSVTVDSNGQFHVKGDFNALAAGETATVRFRYVAVDDSEAGTNPEVGESDTSASKMAEVTIMGTNDQPVVSNVHFDTTEALNGPQTFDGQLSLTSDDDVTDGHTFEIRSTNDHETAHGGYEDNGTPNTVVNVGTDENPILAKVISTSAGLHDISLDSVTVDSDGQFHVTGDFNALAKGETATVRFRYVAVDDSGVGTDPEVGESDTSASKMAEVTIMGTNDAPVITSGQTELDFVSESAGYANVLGIYTIDAEGNPTDPQIVMTDTNGGGDPAQTQLNLALDSFGLFLIPNGDHVRGGIENAALSFDSSHQLLVDGHAVTAYYDNNEWNPGGRDHFDVARNSDGSVIVSIEDLDLGDNDRNDLVVKLTPNLGGTVIEAGISDSGAEVTGVAEVSGDMDASDVDSGAILTWSVDNPSDTYGTFDINPNTGEWTYALDNSLAATDALAEGETVTQTFNVVVTDEHGATDTQNVVINIQGTNDAPVAFADTNSVTEAGVGVPPAENLHGNVLDNDSDVDHNASLSVVGIGSNNLDTDDTTFNGNDKLNLRGEYGRLTMQADGTYTYNLIDHDHDTNALAQGEHAEDVFTYRVSDGLGGFDTQTLTINITGTNDAPVITSDTNTLEFAGLNGEYYGVNTQIDGLATFQNIVASNDPDASFRASDISYGEEGVTTYPGLSGGRDVGTAESLQTFLGNDANTLSSDPGDTSDGGVHMSGEVYLAAGTYNFQVFADDGYQIKIDGNTVAEYADNQPPHTRTSDSFTIESDGYYSVDMLWWDQGGRYIFHPQLSMNEGEYQSFSSDNFDFRATAAASVIEAGTTDSGAVVDGVDEVSGVMVASDVDHGADLTWSVDNPSDTYGTFDINPNTGEWTYALDNSLAATDALAEGDMVTQTFHVVVTDEHNATDTQDVVINIQGTNDAPVATADVITKVADHVEMTDTPDDVSAMTYATLFPHPAFSVWEDNFTNDNATVKLRPNGRYAVDDQNEVIGRHWSLVDDGDKPNFIDSKGLWNEGIIFNFDHNVSEATINLHNIDQNDNLVVALYDDGTYIRTVDTSSIAPNHQVLTIDDGGSTFDEVRIFAAEGNHCNVTDFTVDSVVGNYEMDTVLRFTIDDSMLLANDTDVDGDHLQVQLDDTNLYDGGENVIGSVVLNSDGDIVVTPYTINEIDHDIDNAAHFNYSVVDENGAQSAPAIATIDVALGTVTGSEVSYDQTPQEYIIGTDTDTTPEALSANVLSVDTTLDLSHVSAINTVQLESGATVTGSGDTPSASSITASDVISATDTDNTLVINSSDGDASDQVSVDTTSLTYDSTTGAYASYTGDGATLLIQIDDLPSMDG